MSEGKRPGGLTALAVINLIWGALTVIGGVGMVAAPAMIERAAKAGSEQDKKALEDVQRALAELGSLWHVLVALTFLSALLLLASGVGYLKQRKFLGRTVGNLWAVLSIVSSLAMGVLAAQAVGGGFSLGTILSIVYPALTLFLLNSTFKEDFIR